MKPYRIKFIKNGKVIRQTLPRFYSWENAHHWVTKVIKYRDEYEITCINGIPF